MDKKDKYLSAICLILSIILSLFGLLFILSKLLSLL